MYLWKYLIEIGPKTNLIKYFHKYICVYEPPCNPIAPLSVQPNIHFLLQNSLFSISHAISDLLLLT